MGTRGSLGAIYLNRIASRSPTLRPIVVLVVFLLALPMVGLALLLFREELDLVWEHHPSHFWLVLGVAAINVAVGLAMSEAARRRKDARVFLVSLAFLVSAGFLALHSLATPGMLLPESNTGFTIATPVGLLLAAALAAISSLSFGSERAAQVLRWQAPLRWFVIAVLVLWGAVSLAGLPPLDRAFPEEGRGPLLVATVLAVALYAIAAVRYLGLYRQRRSVLLLAVTVAWVLLAESMVSAAVGRSWHLSWWEWHVLMAAAFGLVAWSARRAYREEASIPAAFSSLYLDHTLGTVDRARSEALQRMITAPGDAARLGEQLGLSHDEAAILQDAASEINRLDAMFRPYLSAQLAGRMRVEPGLTALGGEQREVTVFFADLQDFTPFSERTSPVDVISMLNEYWGEVVPVLERHEGLIENFAGDAVMVVFNAALDQPDHALRACRAALEMQRSAAAVALTHPAWPRFRAGISTGTAIVGNVGSLDRHSFTAVGDTINVASRLQALAPAGRVVISAATYRIVADLIVAEPLGLLELKGKTDPVEGYLLVEEAPATSMPPEA